jgi:glycosyltransferase involved in cell wall biosynthesis
MMAQAPGVSVIIPTYNQAAYLHFAVDSVRAQTYPHHEIIVVDDASTDETQAYLRSQADLRVIRNASNSGPSFSRNQGLRIALGEFVTFLDGDDLLLPDKFQTQVQALATGPAMGMVYGDIQFCDAEGRDLPWRFSRLHAPHPGPDIFEPLTYGNFIPIHAPLVRRSSLDLIGGFEETLRAGAEDWHLWLRLAAAYPVRFQPVVVGKYRIHGGNTSQRRRNLTHSNAVVRRWLIASPLFARLSPTSQHACYLSAGISLAKLGEVAEARQMFAQARRLRPWRPAAYGLTFLTWLGGDNFRKLADQGRALSDYLRGAPRLFGGV